MGLEHEESNELSSAQIHFIAIIHSRHSSFVSYSCRLVAVVNMQWRLHIIHGKYALHTATNCMVQVLFNDFAQICKLFSRSSSPTHL